MAQSTSGSAERAPSEGTIGRDELPSGRQEPAGDERGSGVVGAVGQHPAGAEPGVSVSGGESVVAHEPAGGDPSAHVREPDPGGEPNPRGEPDPRRTPDHGPFYEPWHDPDRAWVAGPPPTSQQGAALAVERRVLGVGRTLDRLQARIAPVAFGYAVFKKYADDEGSRLAALLAYYSFLSLFPLVIGGLAVVNEVLAGRPELVQTLVSDLVPPDYQEQVISSYEALPDSGPAFVIAIVGLLLSGTAGVFSMYAMVNQVFAVPYRHRFGFGPRYLRVLLLVALMGVGVLAVVAGTTALTTVSNLASVQRVGGFGLAWLVASGLLYAAASVLTRRPLGPSELGLGAVLGGLSMTVLLSLGSLLVGRFVASSSAVYGVFATVVGIISALFLISNAVVLCFEISVVRSWRLWPRGIDINLLFPADERALALLALMDERMPSQRNGVAFDATGHDDPRRPDPRSLQRRPSGVPRTPYGGEPRGGARPGR